jgi:signal transduction histidine kinase
MRETKFEVILLSPTGQDALLISQFLLKESIFSLPVKSIDELCLRNQEDAGVILIAEEALTGEGIEKINKSLSQQEPWSDIPIILLTSSTLGKKNLTRIELFVSSGNVTILERPLQPFTLLSAIQVGLRARRRQYEVRELFIAQKEATQVRDDFISIASHELKTPLTSLKLQTQISKRQEEFQTPKIQKQLNSTILQIDRLNKLVDDMLDITRINTGKLDLQRTHFNLSKLLEDLTERFAPQFDAARITLDTQIDKNIEGNWDAFKLEQVVNNLFSNALRYSAGYPVQVSLKKLERKVVLNVIDQGIGIEEKNRERIFERFERATTAARGLGLGLYITRQIVELHGGIIRVESNYGQGSNFIVELPL